MKNPKYTNEKQFQIWLGRKLLSLGFDVYTDRKICELPTFHGSQKKPDLLVFFKTTNSKSKRIDLKSPFAIETKQGDKFNKITKSVLQTNEYHDCKYEAGKWSGEVSNIILTSPWCFDTYHLYEWSLSPDTSFSDGIHWATTRFLFAINKKTGIMLGNNDNIFIEYYGQFLLHLIKNGKIVFDIGLNRNIPSNYKNYFYYSGGRYK